jgi:hypothetical protein
MDPDRLRTGELIAAVSAVALLIIMFAFSWYGLEDAPAGTGGLNAWESYGFIDIILFVTIVVAIGLAIATAMAQTVALPVAASAVTAGLGILSTLLILFRIIATPDLGGEFAGVDFEIETSVKIGAFLGLIAAAGIAYGGWRAMQEEGTSFSGEADRAPGGGEPPPPPPPTSRGPAA